MLLKNKKVAIIGAGPVGLIMARLLQQRSVDVSVYERDKDAQTRISGGPLDLHKGSGQDAMKVAGLLEQYFALALPMGRTVADEKGHILFSENPTEETRFANPEINRNDLKKILLESLTTDTVIWDRKFTRLEVKNEKWALYFENDITATADLVIGANGGMSQARKYVTDAEIDYTGTIILQGDVPQPEIACREFYKKCNGNILMTASNGNLLTANPRNGNLLSYGVTFKIPDNWDKEIRLNPEDKDGIVTFLLDRFSNWHDSFRQLFRSTSSFVVWPTRKISLEIPWRSNRSLPVTLIGDAAHIMPPFAGQGVNIGMVDALILSENLTNGKFDTIESAIHDYETQMFIYASEAQLETSRNEKAMLQSDFSFEKNFRK